MLLQKCAPIQSLKLGYRLLFFHRIFALVDHVNLHLLLGLFNCCKLLFKDCGQASKTVKGFGAEYMLKFQTEKKTGVSSYCCHLRLQIRVCYCNPFVCNFGSAKIADTAPSLPQSAPCLSILLLRLSELANG